MPYFSKPWFQHPLDNVNAWVNILYMRTIVFYRLSTGSAPVEEFLDSLPDKAARKVAWTLTLIEELDQIPPQYFKKLVNTDDI